jgi:hypothetical protein
MSYIRIANKANGVNRLFLEKLGLSTKRDDDSTIGQFGSGSKFAPIAALRNGWEWINVGEDNLGPYKMQYVAKEEGDINCVYYLYDDDILKPSSFTVDAGLLSWDDEFQIFREAFSNALDEFTSSGNEYVVEIVDEVKFEPGMFAVYLTADPSLIDIINNFGKFFSIEREPVYKFADGSGFYEPFDNESNFYYKGVLVHSEPKLAVFDYGMNNVILNEERRIRNTWEINYKVASMLSNINYLTGEGDEIATTLVKNMNHDRWEWTIPKSVAEAYFSDMRNSTTDNTFKRAWRNVYGDKIAVPSNLMRFKAQFSLRNFEIVEVKSDFFYEILLRAGVECADSVLGDEVEYQFMTLTGDKKKMFRNALDIVNKYLPDFNHYVNDIKTFIPQGEQDCIYGVANMKAFSIYLSVNAFRDMELLVSTIVHEFDHLKSRYTDGDNEFRLVADEHIGKLIMQVYGGNV